MRPVICHGNECVALDLLTCLSVIFLPLLRFLSPCSLYRGFPLFPFPPRHSSHSQHMRSGLARIPFYGRSFITWSFLSYDSVYRFAPMKTLYRRAFSSYSCGFVINVLSVHQNAPYMCLSTKPTLLFCQNHGESKSTLVRWVNSFNR